MRDVDEDAFEDRACADDVIVFERLERRATLDPRAMRSEQGVEGFVGLPPVDARDIGGKTVATRQGFDIARPDGGLRSAAGSRSPARGCCRSPPSCQAAAIRVSLESTCPGFDTNSAAGRAAALSTIGSPSRDSRLVLVLN
jgi:hypothetical protein